MAEVKDNKLEFETGEYWGQKTWTSESHQICKNDEPDRVETDMDLYQSTTVEDYWDYLTPANQKKGVHNSTGSVKRCYHSHNPMPLADGLVICGGSCNSPSVKDADVYIGFDYGMGGSKKAYPWNKGESFKFVITDGCPPKDEKEFKKLVSWTIEQVRNGKKVHAGCIGGHGRTGTFLAAVVMEMTGNKDAINYVRDNYCHKAVESKSQVDWLHQHYGVTKAKPSRSWGETTKGKKSSHAGGTGDPSVNFGSAPRRVEEYKPVSISTSVWGNKVTRKY